MEHWTARARRFRYAADDEVALHPIARRRVVAAALLCVSLLALLWPARHGAKPGAGSNCETRDPLANQAAARLIQDRNEAAAARIDDAVQAHRPARVNCR